MEVNQATIACQFRVHSFMVKSYRVGGGGGGLQDYIVSFLGQVIVIVISRPRSLTITLLGTTNRIVK